MYLYCLTRQCCKTHNMEVVPPGAKKVAGANKVAAGVEEAPT